jgi:hypothetical protein
MKVGAALVLAAAATFAAADTAAAAMAADLAPHKAVYDMNLHATKPSSGIVGASGKMSYQFADVCDGWTVENRTALNFSYSEGNQVATTWEFVTWESKDGLRYRFHVRSSRDGTMVEEVEGQAKLDARGEGGVAKFTKPQEMTVKLPKGTLFPTEHTFRAIQRAEAGDKVFLRTIFDGTGTDGPFEVNAIIGAKAPGTGEGEQLIRGAPSWRMNMAFYPAAAKEATPDYEVGLSYFNNGIAKDVIQNFGDFSLRARMNKLEPLPKPDC